MEDGMYKSGLLVGILALLVAAGATLLSPLCTPCAVVFLGLGAGYLAGVFDRPASTNRATRAGAIGGAVGGVGALIGQIAGAVINSVVMGPQGAQQFVQSLGLPSSGGSAFQGGYWATVVGGAVCFSLLDVLLMAAFGALGAYLWWQITGRHAVLAA
jgi:hypothetical protein